MNEKRTKQLISTCFLGSIAISLIMIVGAIFLYHWSYIKEIQCNVGIIPCAISGSSPNPLDGWTEECIENVTIENYKLIKPLTCQEVCYERRTCEATFCQECMSGINPTDLDECSKKCGCYEQNNCFEKCRSWQSLQKPYIQYWNETSCVKKILVKDVTP